MDACGPCSWPFVGLWQVVTEVLPRWNREDAVREDEDQDDSLKPVESFWSQYHKEAESSDKELVQALGVDLDTLLIFVRTLTPRD